MSSTKRVLSGALTGVFALVPLLALGVDNQFSNTWIISLKDTVVTVVNAVIPIMIGLAFIYFAWTLIAYIRSSGDDKEKNKSQLIWSVIAIVLIVSIWGIAGLLQSIFGIGGTADSINTVDITGLKTP
ncbi:MAG: hypothetical protein NTV48_03415 [Candidatus Vogelbacteria bacterium]|nr:hypothetical protein [Candidatus Vogelbacteria bacterium]